MNELHGRWIGGPTFVAKGGKFSTFGPQIEQRGDHEPNHGVKCRWACHTLMYVSSCNTFLFATDSIVSKAPQSMAASPKYDFLSGKGPANTNPWHPSYAISTFLLQIVRRLRSKKAITSCGQKKRLKCRREWTECIECILRLKRCQVLRAVSVETMVASKSLEVRSHDFFTP